MNLEFTPYSIGFDTLFDRLSKINNTNTFPPYNIIKLEENSYIIELALAGFRKEDLNVEVVENVLTITGKPKETNEHYLHRSISNRGFIRKFTLADTVEVINSELIDGMLRIFLENVIPESKKPKVIEINEIKSVSGSSNKKSIRA